MKKVDFLGYTFLFGAVVLGAAGLFSFRGDGFKQLVLILFLSVFYLFWAFVYHSLKRDLSLKLFLEYLLVASIALAAGWFVFLR